MDWHKLNKYLALGLTGEQEEKMNDFFRRISRWNIKVLPAERIFCEDMGVDPRLAAILKEGNNSRIRLLPGCRDYNVDFDLPPGIEGVCALWFGKDGDDPVDEISRVLYHNKLKYKALGYNLFAFVTGYDMPSEDWYLALAKGKTDLDILRWRGTNGINHGIYNDVLIAKIEEWQQRYDLVLWWCGADEFRIHFIHEHPEYMGGTRSRKWYEQSELWDKRTPKFRKFAEEVIEFCPDLVWQVYKGKTELIKEMERMNGVFFWWD